MYVNDIAFDMINTGYKLLQCPKGFVSDYNGISSSNNHKTVV